MTARPASPRSWPARLFAAACVAAALGSQAFALDFGVNIHRGGTPEFNSQRAEVMKLRNIRHARMDYTFEDDLAAFRDQAQKIRAIGGTVQVVLWPRFGKDNSCNPDLAAVEKDAYTESVGMINKVRDLVHDFELLNENQHRTEIRAVTEWNSMGLGAAPFRGKPCMASLAAGLRGMSKAIRDVRASSGLPLRSILGLTGRDFGFLYYMQEQGVLFDVIGFHSYPEHVNASLTSDPWWGPGGPYVQLAKFRKPVHFNEFNCGETYKAEYENEAGMPVTEQCLRSLARHLREMINQKTVRIESMHVYELLDEPEKADAEGKFGLMYDLKRPKLHMAVIAAFTGGALTAQERCQIVRRELVTDAEIDARRRAANLPPGPRAASEC